jgi:hypothetical protein
MYYLPLDHSLWKISSSGSRGWFKISKANFEPVITIIILSPLFQVTFCNYGKVATVFILFKNICMEKLPLACEKQEKLFVNWLSVILSNHIIMYVLL